ncbi:divalent metal cation transporter, partial [Staphylococcus capitis]|uniref:divalent metal cation transporter n=1 Tax=Staphylococcus capitis TaxID=29388 RepID=UPI003704C288
MLTLPPPLFFPAKTNHLPPFYHLYHPLKTQPLLGATLAPVISTLFPLPLLPSPQNSTITRTLTRQILIQRFLPLSIPNSLRRLITRALAVMPH